MKVVTEWHRHTHVGPCYSLRDLLLKIGMNLQQLVGKKAHLSPVFSWDPNMTAGIPLNLFWEAAQLLNPIVEINKLRFKNLFGPRS